MASLFHQFIVDLPLRGDKGRVWLDGQLLRGVTAAKVESAQGSATTITLTMYGDVLTHRTDPEPQNG